MLKNCLKIAFRNIQRYKGYSLINIVGLALGMACCILILLWAKDELATSGIQSVTAASHSPLPVPGRRLRPNVQGG